MKAEVGVFPKDRQILHEILPLDTPLSMDIHLLHFCNFRCRYCIFSQTDDKLKDTPLKRGIMSWETFSCLVDQLKAFPRKIKMISLTGGEPTTHPCIVDMVKKLHDAGVTEKIQIITNGSRLTPELGKKLVAAGLGEIKISLQGLSSEKYYQVSKVKINWDEFYENICSFSKIRNGCALKVKIADVSLEEGEEEKFYHLFGDICDAVAVEHIYEAWTHNDYSLDIEEKLTQKTRYGLDHRKITVCRGPFTRFDIMPDGLITQSCHITFGHEKNILESSVAEQWNCHEQNQLRLKMLTQGRMQFPECKICNICENVWHPEDLLEGHEAEIAERIKHAYCLGDE